LTVWGVPPYNRSGKFRGQIFPVEGELMGNRDKRGREKKKPKKKEITPANNPFRPANVYRPPAPPPAPEPSSGEKS
jgi:hypothetical protein